MGSSIIGNLEERGAGFTACQAFHNKFIPGKVKNFSLLIN
jgi:hypothetical protein